MEVRERIDELAGRLTELRDAYYRGDPLVADADYDALEDELRALIAEHPDLTPDPNPLEQVGAPAVLHAPVRHSRPMLSLEKATKPEQVAAFFDRFPGQPVIVMPKLDGLSLAVVYERGRLARAVTRGDGTTGDDVTLLVRALADGVPERIDAGGRVEVRGEPVMLRSTFAAYNEAHPDKPLINPRNAAAGTVRAKDPAMVAERRLRFFAFDLDAEDGAARRPRGGPEDARLRRRRHAPHRGRGRGAGGDHGDRGRAQRPRLRPRRRGPAARRPQRLRRRRHARQQPARRARLQVRGRGEDHRAGRRRVGRRQDRQGRAGRRARARVRRRHDGDAGDAGQPGGHPRARRADRRHRAGAPRGRRHPLRGRRARRLQAHRRRARDRAARRVSVVRAAADRAGQQPRAVLHQRRLPGADRAAADPLGIARSGRHRRDRPGVDRAPQRGGRARAPVGLLRAHPRAAARVRAHRRHLRRPDDRVDRPQPRRRAAARADRPVDPDGLRGHGGEDLPRRLHEPGGGGRRRRGGAPAGRGHRAEGRRQPARAPQPRHHAGRAGAAARAAA